MSDHSATARQIRSGLNHPVVDADGHWLEYGPAMEKRMQRAGGARAVEGLHAAQKRTVAALSMSVAERSGVRLAQEGFWPFHADATDRATVMMPQLFYQRLDDIGIDFAVLYPTAGLPIVRLMEPEVRRATCRAYNIATAEYFDKFRDRMTPAAIIPMFDPEEAVAELEYAKRQLGMKVFMLGSLARRVLPSVSEFPDGGRVAEWYDPLGLDSAYDYDPVWRACAELGISPTFHTGARWQGFRMSPSNFVYNHVGGFATASEAVCKALFLGGVTRRFPGVKFAFLEGGVGWASILFGDLIGHWQKRNRKALELTDPRRLDSALMLELAEAHASGELLDVIRERGGRLDSAEAVASGGIMDLDDFSACRIERKEDFKDLFAGSFYFGCEADDHTNAWAFNQRANPLGARLNAMFGSDIAHFDVPDMTKVLPEAHELVDDGLITQADFRDFTFENAVRFWGSSNPDFYKGTVVEQSAGALLAKQVREMREAAAPAGVPPR